MTFEKSKIIIVQSGFPRISATFILDQITGLLDREIPIENWATYNPNEKVIHPAVTKYELDKTCNYLSIPKQQQTKTENDWHSEFKLANPHFNLSNTKVVHIHFALNYNSLAPLFRSWDGKLIVSFHGHDASRYVVSNGPDCYQELFDRAQIITTPTHIMKGYLVSLGCNPEKIKVHTYGVDLDSYSPEKNRVLTSKARILTVARLVEKKGVEFTIKALSLIDPDLYEYRIIGEGPEFDTLKKLSHSLNVKSLFLGSLNKLEVLEELKKTDIMALNSVTADDGDQEGLPVSLIEAQAMGIPVVSSYHSGIPELIINKSNGLLSNEKDVESISKNILDLIEDIELRRKMSLAAREVALKRFDIKDLNDRLFDMYSD